MRKSAIACLRTIKCRSRAKPEIECALATPAFAQTGVGHDGQLEQAILMTRDNVIYLVIGALVVAVAVLGYQLYEAKKEPSGLHINLGEKGLSIESK
jgi:hypothetical protein